jgi:preprotein translocase subunit SecF
MLYIALRFDVRFAPGAIVALAHDVIVVVGAMCITQREITLSTVAAILTIIGYSLSDTVVVFDRIRENLGKFRNKSFPDLVNLSVSEMLGRTIVSNGTSMLALICFLWFGTQVIKDFAFAMLVGAIVGTYSSIYVAAPFTEWVDRRFFANKVVKARPKPPRQRAQKQADAVV